ncbi:hypothetical protein [Novosphingobium sp. ST904]|uniref:hypothetical protein n=1 Tax=Novosphingobium sp. ST904 TaxID=1684385 RepID=UPI0006C8B132|nr:hypothetical protein [Novosphingobium sp. ST904]KPH62311.1 hypothetical protein ADT71_15325 [Novosphingobium sp. ST904]TCM43352.1 hypothetical protein EDF59_101456 [Novosphingobium sp. ST904]
MRRQDPFEPIVIWRSDDWRPDGSEDAPIFRHDWPELLGQCRRAVARREEMYPQLVAAKRLDEADARADLDAWKLLAAEWHWIVTGEGEAPGLPTLAARIEAVSVALGRAEAELQRNYSHDLLYQRHLLLALAWHLGDGRAGPAIHHTARINHAWQAERAAQALRSAA